MVFDDPRLAPYTGDKPFIFLSYSHLDASEAGEIIRKLKGMGLRVWYDEGLSPGEVFSNELAMKILNSSCYIGLMSRNYLNSRNCMNELNYALERNKHSILIYLEKADVPEGVALQTIQLHVLHRYKDGDRIYEKLLLSEEVKQCLLQPDELADAPTGSFPDPAKPTEKVKTGKGNKPYLPVLVLCALLVLGLGLYLILRSLSGKPEDLTARNTGTPGPDPASSAAPAPASTRKPSSAPNYETVLLGETFAYDSEQYASSEEYYAAAEKRPAFGLTVQRCEVQRLTFLPDAADRPADARDISPAGDGSIWAWVERRDALYDLTVAADGGLSLPENAFGTFAGYSLLEEIVWNDAVSFGEVRDARFLFADCGSLTSLELRGQASPTNLRAAFANCGRLESLDLTGLCTESTTDLSYMFRYCSSLKELDLDPETFRTENAETMAYMFHGCSALTRLDLSFFRTDHVANMSYMFGLCSGLVSLTLDPEGFRTDNVTNMQGMFSKCSGLTRLDISFFDTARVTDMSFLFNDCSALTALSFDPEKFYTGKVTTMKGMFQNCSGLAELDLTCFNTAAVTDMSYMFSGCGGLTALRWDPETFRTGKVTTMQAMFYTCSSLTALDIAHFNTTAVTDMSYLFSGCSSLKVLRWDPETFRTDKVTTMYAMFHACSGLAELDLSGFNTAAVTDMGFMFSRCSGLTALRWDPETFRTDRVTNMQSIFYGCAGLTELDLSAFRMENAENTALMFSGCTGLRAVTFSTPVYLGAKMFAESAVIEVHIPEGLTGAAENAFEGGSLRVYYSARSVQSLADALGKALGGEADWILEDPVLSGSPGLDGTVCGSLFDGDIQTFWRADMGQSPYVEWYVSEPLRVTVIHLKYVINTDGDGDRTPCAWKLYGRDSPEEEWKLVLTQNRNASWTISGLGELSKTIAYRYRKSNGEYTPHDEIRPHRYFRLVFLETFGEDSPVLQLSEFVLEDDEEEYNKWFDSLEKQTE